MATIKRKKISSKATKGQKTGKGWLKSKKFWIIFSSIVLGLILIGVAIALIVYFTTQDEEENEIQDYFGGEATNLSYEYEGNEVSFTKISYDGLKMHTNVEEGSDSTFVNYAFVFATDLSTFYADKAIDDGKDKDDDDEIFYYSETANKVFNQLVKLQGEVDKYNASTTDDIKVSFYVVDLSIGDNNSLLADSAFGGADDSEAGSLFALMTQDGLVKDYKNTASKTVSLYSNDLNTIQSSTVNAAIVFMKDQNFKSND